METEEYEKQLREENDKLREKLAEALIILDQKKKLLNSKIMIYGDKKVTENWEPNTMGAMWEQYKTASMPTKPSKRK